MSDQILIRRDPNLITQGWTSIPNTLIRDKSLSIEARWLWSFIHSHHGTFVLRMAQMQEMAGVGRDKMRAMLKELEGSGYLTREQKASTDGKYGLIAYHLHNPWSEPSTETPATASPSAATPATENQSPATTSANATGDVFPGDGSTGDGGHDPIKKTISKKTKEHVGAVAPRAKRGSRLPEDFTVTEPMRVWYSENCPRIVGQGREHTEEFRNHWAAAGGSTAVKIDWVAAWRNWMIKANRWSRNDAAPRRGSVKVDQSNGRQVEMP